MQAVFLFASVLAVSSAGIISVVPVSYISSPLPSYNQAQNTRTGEYAYSYAGGPSAKEEVKTLDGVTRGAYSYIDAHGIVQSVQYVADDHGFRVVGTNIPTDAQVGVNVPLESAEVQAAKAAHFAEHAKAIALLGRRKRSLSYSSFPTAVSSQYHNQEHESIKIETPYQHLHSAAVPLAYASYNQVPVVAPLAVSSAPTSVSHQSRHQVHESSKLEVSAPVYAEAVEAVKTVPVEVYSGIEPVQVQPVSVASVPTAVSSQSRYQVHNSRKLEVHAPAYAPSADVVDSFRSIPFDLETVYDAPVAVSTVPTSVSSQSRAQVHSGAKIEVHSPVYAEEGVASFSDSHLVDSYGRQISSLPVVANAVHASFLPTALSSQSRSQVHSSQTLEAVSPIYASNYLSLPQAPLDTPEVAAAKRAHAEAYAAEVVKHHGW